MTMHSDPNMDSFFALVLSPYTVTWIAVKPELGTGPLSFSQLQESVAASSGTGAEAHFA